MVFYFDAFDHIKIATLYFSIFYFFILISFVFEKRQLGNDVLIAFILESIFKKNKYEERK